LGIGRKRSNSASRARIGQSSSPRVVAPSRREKLMRREGFTLLEILLALGLIGLLSAVLITGGIRVLTEKPQSVEDVFWQAVRRARDVALERQMDVQLKFDPKTREFTAQGTGYAESFTVAAPANVDLAVEFIAPGDSRGALLIGGILTETQTMAGATFYSDGTCSPFRLQIRRGGVPRVLSIDPWTCAPMLRASDERRP